MDEHSLEGHEETLGRLESIARERWGNAWTIVVELYADDTASEYVEHSAGLVAPSEHDFADDTRVIELERIWIDDDSEKMYWARIHKPKTDVYDDEIVESQGELPE